MIHVHVTIWGLFIKYLLDMYIYRNYIDINTLWYFWSIKKNCYLQLWLIFFNAYFFLQWYFHFDIRFSLEQLQLSTKMVILYRVTNIT